MSNDIINNSENATIELGQEEKIEDDTASVYKGMNEVFAHTRQIIADMKQGDKITVKDLADKVHAHVMDLPTGNVTNLVQMFIKKSKDVTVEIGRGGGVFKGGKPKRVDNRPRCLSCNQVIRPDMHKNNSNNSESVAQ